ncbi:MAG: tRNA pseudouridine(13) synthase TruD [Euryarchaeota archaeon]|nr:tRNA pseudouridine(13) synthase TruD [Euryarchaeota archaeon]
MEPPPEEERRIGLERYLTSTPGLGGVLKVEPADFVVEEIPLGEIEGRGDCLVVEVVKENRETHRTVQEIARGLHVSRARVSYAGLKDRRAHTLQRMSIRGVTPEMVRGLHIPGVEVRPLGFSPRPITLGDLGGNRFRVAIRRIPFPAGEAGARARATREAIQGAGGVPNYFGPQRFGTLRPVTHLVGEHLVREDLEGALMAYLALAWPEEAADAREARLRLSGTRDYAGALREFPPRLRFERSILQRLVERPGDWAYAWEALPPGLRRLFVHAHQAYLFNRVLSIRMARGLPLGEPRVGDILLLSRGRLEKVTPRNLASAEAAAREGRARPTGPLYGPECPLAEGEPGEAEQRVLQESGIDPGAYARVPGAPSRGTRRPLLLRVEPLPGPPEPDLVGHSRVVLEFTLDPGAYATVVLREFIKGPMERPAEGNPPGK